MVDVLLAEFSADVNCHDDELWTPLHSVALCGHTLVARRLIDWYALRTGVLPNKHEHSCDLLCLCPHRAEALSDAFV